MFRNVIIAFLNIFELKCETKHFNQYLFFKRI